MSDELEHWVIGEPRGPYPSYSLVSSTGRVIAVGVPSRQLAERLSALPELIRVCQALADILELGESLASVAGNQFPVKTLVRARRILEVAKHGNSGVPE